MQKPKKGIINIRPPADGTALKCELLLLGISIISIDFTEMKTFLVTKNFVIILSGIFLSQVIITKKIDEKVSEEEAQLSKWLNRSEEELKIVPDSPTTIKLLFP